MKHKGNLADFLKKLAAKDELYTGYNLLAGDGDDLYYYSNISRRLQKLEPGIYGSSNALLDTGWPKVKKGKEKLRKIVAEKHNDFVDLLFSLLRDAGTGP